MSDARDAPPAADDDDDAIFNEAKERFDRCVNWESRARANWLEDYKFSHGDSINKYQWQSDIEAGRVTDEKPALTINKCRQHVLQILNDAKQNKPSVKFRPVGDEATKEAADIYDGLMRHTEYISKAQIAYDTASSFQIRAGIGYIRVDVDYVNDDTFDQEVYIRRVKDPLTVYLDPDAQEADYSDGRFAFVFEDVPRDLYRARYPNLPVANVSFSLETGWLTDRHIRVAEYWRKTEFQDELLYTVDPETGDRAYVRRSRLGEELYRALAADKNFDPKRMSRKIRSHQVQQFTIVGTRIAERNDWAGSFIPIVPVIGEETVIDKQMDRKGHTRALRDPQRMFNYWVSEATAQIALQTKTPYVAPAQAIEGYETFWDDLNKNNLPYLPYNALDDQGNPIPRPEREAPATPSQAYMVGMQFSENQMMMVTGQYQSQFGEPSNEKSGKAIAERQRQGDNATYHFIDGLAIAVRQIGRICGDLYTKIYDTRRIQQIMGEDGSERLIVIDPNAQQAYLKHVEHETQTIVEIFNPNVGLYDVQADIGPNYSTRRQEAWNAFVQIAAQSPQVMQIAGDLVFKAADFPMAEQLAERYKRTIPPGILGDDGALPPAVQQMIDQGKQQVAQLMQQNQALHQQAQKAAADLGVERLRNAGKGTLRDIEAYRAETDRLGVVAKAGMDHQMIAQIAAQLVLDAMNTPITAAATEGLPPQPYPGGAPSPPGVVGGPLMPTGGAPNAAPPTPAGAPPLGGMPNGLMPPPIPGARMAPDGRHYVPDPRRPGRYLMVA